MNSKTTAEIEEFVTQWAMERGAGYGMGGFDVRRLGAGKYEACIELHRHIGDEKPARTMFRATGATKAKAERACLATALRAMADELSPPPALDATIPGGAK